MRSPFIQLIIASSFCIAALASYGFWYATVEAESARVAQLESQITSKTETASRIASAQASLAEIAGNEASIQAYFVPETGVVSFINNLEAIGRAQGSTVSVGSVAPGGTAVQPTFTFSVTVKGSFDAVMRTIGVIEYAPYDLVVSSLAVTQDAKNTWHADLSLLVGSVPATVAPKKP